MSINDNPFKKWNKPSSSKLLRELLLVNKILYFSNIFRQFKRCTYIFRQGNIMHFSIMFENFISCSYPKKYNKRKCLENAGTRTEMKKPRHARRSSNGGGFSTSFFIFPIASSTTLSSLNLRVSPFRARLSVFSAPSLLRRHLRLHDIASELLFLLLDVTSERCIIQLH